MSKKSRVLAVDYDNTWTAAPKLFADLGEALRSQGWRVVVLTGNEGAQSALSDEGYKKSYDDVIVVDSDPHDEQVTASGKSQWLAENDADFLIDNNSNNCVAATRACDAALFFPQQPKKELKSRPAGVSVGMATPIT